jgi:hypothetical protein
VWEVLLLSARSDDLLTIHFCLGDKIRKLRTDTSDDFPHGSRAMPCIEGDAWSQVSNEVPMEETLLERLGGRAALARLLEAFNDRVIRDSTLAHHLGDIPRERLTEIELNHLLGLFAQAESDPVPALSSLTLTSAELERFAQHFVDVLSENAISLRIIQEVLNVLAPLRAHALARPEAVPQPVGSAKRQSWIRRLITRAQTSGSA